MNQKVHPKYGARVCKIGRTTKLAGKIDIFCRTLRIGLIGNVVIFFTKMNGVSSDAPE